MTEALTSELSSQSPSGPGADGSTPHPALDRAGSGGIEILVEMARRGEIDPKNIDIIDVTDRFLKVVARAPKENLRQSGRVIFHASVLLRMKAEALLAMSADAGDDFLDFEADGSPIIYDSHLEPVARQITLQDLERALIRRSTSRQLRQRKVTLEQLIEALREAERIEKSRAQRHVEPRVVLEGHTAIKDVEDILELAHDEDIETIIERVEQILVECFGSGGVVSLLDLIGRLNGRGDWVDAFLAVLFLSNAGKIALEQEEFYGPLYVARADGQIPYAQESRL